MLTVDSESPLYTDVYLYTAEQSRLIDKNTVASGIAGYALMQKAGLSAFELIQQRWPDQLLHIFCGTGNNGGDGFVIASLAKQQGIEATIYLCGDADKIANEAQLAYKQAVTDGVMIMPIDTATQLPAIENGVIVDALLGTGLSQAPRALASECITLINALLLPVIAIDVPSGLCSDSGQILAQAIKADVSISFITQKRGLFTAAGSGVVGERIFDDLQAPLTAYQACETEKVRLLNLNALLENLPARDAGAHKGTMGHAAMFGGDLGMAGAAVLAATAAARMGAGLTTLSSRSETIQAMLNANPEIMSAMIDDSHSMVNVLDKASVLAIGPGLGQSDWSRRVLAEVERSLKLQVWDADALNLLACEHDAGIERMAIDRILTPHPGEAARLLNTSTAEVQRDRFSAVKQLQRRYGGVVVLKGNGTLLCWQTEGQQQLALCPYGNPAMASGGMGDVLTGVIAGLLAQTDLCPSRDTIAGVVCLAVCLHGAAADRLVIRHGERGLLAGDLIAAIRALLNQKPL